MRAEIEGTFAGVKDGRHWGFFHEIDTVIGTTPVYRRVDFDSLFLLADSLDVKLIGNSTLQVDFRSTPGPDFSFNLEVENPATNEEAAFFKYESRDEESGATVYARASFFYEDNRLTFQYEEDSGADDLERRQEAYTLTATRAGE